MNSFRIMLRSFIKSKVLFAITCVAFTIECAFCIFINVLEGTFSFTTFGGSVFKFSQVFLVLFLFLSYEFFSKSRNVHMHESVSVTANGERRLYGAQFAVMSLGCLLFFMPIAVSLIIGYVKQHVNHMEALSHMLLVGVLQILLISFLGVLMGLLLALRLKRLPAYLILTAFIFVSSPQFETIAARLHARPIYEFFNFSLYLDFVPNTAFGFSLLPYRWARMGLWLFAACLGIGLLLYKNNRRKRLVSAAVATVLCAGCVALFLLPTSKVDLREFYELNEIDYYEAHPQQEKSADFQIKKYQMDFSIGLQLKAKVTMTLSNSDLSVYQFTLDHGYRVKQVTDANQKPLVWQCDSDYITIQNDNAHDFSQITIEYAGSNMTYYSNLQGTYLSGGFPYYPKAGFYVYFLPENQIAVSVYDADDTAYQMTVHCSRSVYTNLTKQPDGSYQGDGSGVTLMSGFLDEITVDGTRVIYPYMAVSTVTSTVIKTEIKKAEQYLNVNTLPLKTIFSVPNMNNGGYKPLYTDSMELLGFIDFIHDYNRARINPEKEWLYTVTMFYNERPASFQGALESEADPDNDSEPIATTLNNLIKKIGKEKALKLVDAYLFDNSDTRAPYAFIKELLESEEKK